MLEIDQVPARRWHTGNVRPVGSGVPRFEGARAHVGDQLRHDILGFAQHKMLNRREGLVPGREERTAGDERFAKGGAPRDDFLHGLLMDNHRAEHDIIGPAQIAVFEALEVQVHQLELPIGGQHGSDGEQTERRESRALGDTAQDMLETPERVWAWRIDQ
jgi:hypothetical protein